jgi:hypothetical protein
LRFENFEHAKHFLFVSSFEHAKHFLFVSSFEHVNFAINEKIPKKL